jgi:hypothetical protein
LDLGAGQGHDRVMSWSFLVLTLGLQQSIDAPRHFDPGAIDPGLGCVPAQIEVGRIQRHLRHVEQTLRAEPTPGLTPQQQRARAQMLDALRDYWLDGEFPQNRDYPDRRVPYFIDADGVACAVGHLMIESGARDLAREIATYENNDFLADIDHPGVAAWLRHSGLSFTEAAWIQPTYGPCGFEDYLVCGSDGKTYLCPYVAMDCAGVDVASEGACGSDTDGGTGDPQDIIGEEICGAMTSGATVGDTGTATATGGSETGDEPDDDKGCSVGGRAAAAPWLVLWVVAAVRRRRA